MVSTHRSIPRLLSLVFVFTAAIGCSTTPDTPDEHIQPVEVTGPESLIQSEDVLLATRVVPDDLSSLTPLFQRVAQTVDHPQAREFADISPDPIGHLRATHDMPNELEALAHDRASYVLLTHRGNSEFLEIAGLGLPTYTDEWPAYFNARLLLSTDDVDELDDQLTPWLDRLVQTEAIGAFEVYDGPGFVRVELAVTNTGTSAPDDVDAAEWLADLNLDDVRPPATANYRETPAYQAFVDADTPFGAWSPAEVYSRLAAFELLELFAMEHDKIGPAGQPRHFLEGVARVAAASVADDPTIAEHEDVSMLMGADDDDALFVDMYTTRTEHGIEVREAMDESIDLPGFATDNRFLDLNIQGNVDAIEQLDALPHWTRFDDDAAHADAGFQPDPDAVDETLVSFSDDPSGFVPMAMAAQYPRTAFAASSDAIDQIVPLPRALAIESFTRDNAIAIPLGAAAAAAFDDSPDTRMAIEQLLGFAEGAMPGQFDAELIDRDDDLVEVHLVFGEDLDAVFGDTTEPRDADGFEFSFEMGPVRQLAGIVPGSEAMELFDHLHLRTLAEETYQTYRISIGTPQALAPQPVQAHTEPLANPAQRCRTEMAGLAVEHLSDLRANPWEKVDRWADEMTTRADDCLEPGDYLYQLIEERIDLAQQLADEIP